MAAPLEKKIFKNVHFSFWDKQRGFHKIVIFFSDFCPLCCDDNNNVVEEKNSIVFVRGVLQ